MLNRTPQSRETLVNCLILATALKYIFRLNDLVRKLFIPRRRLFELFDNIEVG